MAKNDKAPAAGAPETSAPDPAEVKPAAPSPAKAPPGDGTRTPDEWAALKGRTIDVRVTRRLGNEVKFGIEKRPDHIHAAAATLHGWDAHAYHAGEPIRLDESGYDGAIQAVLDWGKQGRSVVAHEPAVSPHHPLEHVAEINARIAREVAEENA